MLNSVYERLAEATWQRLAQARYFNVRLGEETLTDILVLEWASSPLSSLTPIKLYQTTKSEEAIRGTDIEMRVGVGHGAAIVAAIQAKKLNRSTSRYDSLNALTGNTRSRQIDVLEAYARQTQAMPLYLLYNHVTAAHIPTVWHCGLPFDPPQLGCTLVPSARVREVLARPRGRRTFRHIHSFPDAIPWRCIECPRGLDSISPCAGTGGRVERLSTLAETVAAREGAWPGWLWDRPSDTPLVDDELTELHGREVRLPDELPAMEDADSTEEPSQPTDAAAPDRAGVARRAVRPRLTPRWILLVNQGDLA